MCVLGGVLFFEIECKGMQTITQGDTQTLIKLNNCNKTGDLDIFSISSHASATKSILNLSSCVLICNVVFLIFPIYTTFQLEINTIHIQ